MRRVIILIFFLCLAILIIFINGLGYDVLKNEVYEYYLANSYRETGAKNVVTGIYLNYRMFDTMFEALILLLSIIAIIHFSRYEGGHENE